MKKLFFLSLVFFYSTLLFPAEINFKELFPKTPFNGIANDGNSIWFSSYGKGIFQYLKDEDRWIIYSTENKNIDSDFFYCIAASDDFVWAGTSDGLLIYDRKRKQWKRRKFAEGGEFGNWIRSLAYDKHQNKLYIGRFINLTVLDVARQRFDDFNLTVNNDLKTNNIKTIEIENENFIWFGTEAGVFRYDKSKSLDDNTSLEFYNNRRNSFRAEGDAVSVSAIEFEKKFIWFGTDEFITPERPKFNVGGIYRYNRRATWQKFDDENGLGANGVYALELSGNYIWAALYQFDKKNKKEVGKGLVLIDRRDGKVLEVNPDKIRLASNTITALKFDGVKMWIATDNGLWQVAITNPFAQFVPRNTPK